MKKILIIIIILLTLSACATKKVQIPESTSTGIPEANIPTPASVYCEKQGNTLEIHTAADGSQSGVCIFPDGSTCDEWAYYRSECSPGAKTTSEPMATVNPNTANASGGYMEPGTSEPIEDWWGIIKSTPPGAQYDDYFERQDLGVPIYFGIDSLDPVLKAQIEDLRDSGKIVHLYGTLLSNVPDYNGSQILVDHIIVE